MASKKEELKLDPEDEDLQQDKRKAGSIEEEQQVGEQLLFDCGCCFGEYEREERVFCSANNNHLACKDCVYNHVSEQIDGKNTTNIPCISDYDCIGTYAVMQLDNILSPKLKARYNERVFLAEINSANMPDLW